MKIMLPYFSPKVVIIAVMLLICSSPVLGEGFSMYKKIPFEELERLCAKRINHTFKRCSLSSYRTSRLIMMVGTIAAAMDKIKDIKLISSAQCTKLARKYSSRVKKRKEQLNESDL